MDSNEESSSVPRHVRWISYAACVWAVLFAAPHLWWALGISAGFPGGEASYHRFMSSTWRYLYDVVVVLLSVLALVIALTLLRPPGQVVRRWIPHTAAWIACGMLSLRGVAGMIVDGTSDPVWWPTFLLGGVLFGGVAWFARRPKAAAVLIPFLLLVLSCRPAPVQREVMVRATEYAFQAPDSLPAGPTVFGLENAGRVAHEVIVIGLRPEATLSEIVRRDRADSTWRHLREPTSGILTADSGITTPGRLLVNLVAGRTYLLVCNFQDSDEAPPHLHLGMARLIKVY